ncbi:MAG: hypothetical protein ACHQM6_10530, partial [Candidatus Kapaibacterium sp.]
MRTRIFIYLLGFLLAGKLQSQTFTIDSVAIDEVNSQLSVFSNDLDFAHAYVYVMGTRLAAAQKISGGFAYRLPDSGNGSMGNITIFAGGTIDSNWKITLWTEIISYRDTLPVSLYNQYGPQMAGNPPVKSAKYYFYFRTAERLGLAEQKIQCPHLNRRSHAAWDYTAELTLVSNSFEEYSGSGYLPVVMDDSLNIVSSSNDSVFFSYAYLMKLACSFSFYQLGRTTTVLASGNDTLYLDNKIFGLKKDSSGSVVHGQTTHKGSAGFGPNDSIASVTISWSDLTSESPYF